ncbi:MAG TPA: plastocyanin/azurin family copper-binding protein [Longimicrobium sp.]
MRHATRSLALLPALLLSAACSDTSGTTGRVQLQDDCDPATFNAALGAGNCTHASSSTGVTLANFNAELQATQKVSAWRMVPATMSVREGATLDVVNLGGETHSYTEVENFGGGRVPALNQASGNTTVAPECMDQATFEASVVPSGQTKRHTFDETGTEKYQCCVHPWMRQTVMVR